MIGVVLTGYHDCGVPDHLPGERAAVEGDEPGVSADIVCPICQGKLTETRMNGFHMYRCHVGHSFSLETVAAEQAEEVEKAESQMQQADLIRRILLSGGVLSRADVEEKPEETESIVEGSQTGNPAEPS